MCRKFGKKRRKGMVEPTSHLTYSDRVCSAMNGYIAVKFGSGNTHFYKNRPSVLRMINRLEACWTASYTGKLVRTKTKKLVEYQKEVRDDLWGYNNF